MASVVTITYDSTTATNDSGLTIASLATSSTLTTGREVGLLDNSSNQYVDMQIMGQIMTGTSPSAGTIALYAWSALKRVASANTYPQAGTTQVTVADAAATWDAEQLNNLPLIWSSATNTTSNRPYSINVKSLRALFGGSMPIYAGIYLAHSTGVNLNATAGNHWIHWSGIKYTGS